MNTPKAKVISDENEKRTTLSLSLTVSDKKVLKRLALEKDTTVASIIHEWIYAHEMEEKHNGKS